MWYNSPWLWRWLPYRLSKHQSLVNSSSIQDYVHPDNLLMKERQAILNCELLLFLPAWNEWLTDGGKVARKCFDNLALMISPTLYNASYPKRSHPFMWTLRQQEVPNPRWPVDGHILLPALKKVSLFLLILLIKICWSEHSFCNVYWLKFLKGTIPFYF